MTTYEEYCQLRIDCGWGDGQPMIESVWNGCKPDAQESMLEQLRAAARERQAELDQFGGDHW